MNQVIVSGNLGRDVEIRQSKTGKTFGLFSIAVKNTRPTSDVPVENTTWFDCVAFWETVSRSAPGLRKGAYVCLFGRLEVSTYQSKDGTEKKAPKILVNQIYFGQSATELPAVAPVDDSEVFF